MSLNMTQNPLNFNFNEATIMVVDDNASNILLMEKILNLAGYYDIIVTLDAEKVVPLYEQHKPDLILLDLYMPKLNGFDILERLNKVKGDAYVPVIMVSAQATKDNKLRALELGVNDFVGKPFDPIEISMRVQNMLNMRLMYARIKMENRDLEVNIEKRTREILDLQFEIIKRLMLAVELKDNDTGSHIVKIGLYAYEIAKAMGMDDDFCYMIQYAGMMHDVGKIGISDGILQKPGPLTPEEWHIMRSHTTKGANILSGSTNRLIQMSEEIALSHHEKWDGSGYPLGLIGEEIPLSGRIIAICDVFDALVTKRPYKEAFTTDEAIRIILSENGKHFDPIVVKIFIEKLDMLLQIDESLRNH